MSTSYPALHSTSWLSLTTAIPAIIIHSPSPQQLSQLLPNVQVSGDGSMSRGYDEYSHGVASAKISVQDVRAGRPQPRRQPHAQANFLYCPLVAEKPGWGAASSRASFEVSAFVPSELDRRTRTCGSNWHISTRAGRDGHSVTSPRHVKYELPQPILMAVDSVMEEEERLVRLLAVIPKERSPMYIILCEELRKARIERLKQEDQEARSLLGSLVRDLELE